MNAEEANIKAPHSMMCSEQNQARGSVFFLGVELAQRGAPGVSKGANSIRWKQGACTKISVLELLCSTCSWGHVRALSACESSQ